jgi:hypothetical protein
MCSQLSFNTMICFPSFWHCQEKQNAAFTYKVSIIFVQFIDLYKVWSESTNKAQKGENNTAMFSYNKINKVQLIYDYMFRIY